LNATDIKNRNEGITKEEKRSFEIMNFKIETKEVFKKSSHADNFTKKM